MIPVVKLDHTLTMVLTVGSMELDSVRVIVAAGIDHIAIARWYSFQQVNIHGI